MVDFFEFTFDSLLVYAIAIFGIGVYVLGIVRYKKANTKLKSDLLIELHKQEETEMKSHTELIATSVKERSDTIHQAIRNELAEAYETIMSDVRAARIENLETQIQLHAVKTSLRKQNINVENGGDEAFERDIKRKMADIESDTKSSDNKSAI